MTRYAERPMARAAALLTRRLLCTLAPLALLGAAAGAGCSSVAAGHCGNGSGDQQCRDGAQGMFCSQCTLENDGCVDELPADASCHVANPPSGEEEGTMTSSTGPGQTQGSTSESGSTDTDVASSGGLPDCAELGNTCLQAAPADFNGPVAVLTEPADGRPSSCAEPFGELATEAFSELVAPDATCPCACGTLMGGACGNAQVRRYSAAGCVGTPTNTLNPVAGCNNFPGTWSVASGSFYFQAPSFTAGSCDAESSVELEPATYVSRHRVCQGSFEQMTCASGELCMPSPGGDFAPQWCVWQDGEHECPADSVYTAQTVLYRDTVDGRGCEACMCDLPEGPCTGTGATLAVETNCMGSAAGTLSPNACVAAIGAGPPAEAVSVNMGLPLGACVPSEPAPTGEATPADPVTLCCTR